MTESSGIPETTSPGRGPFRTPPPEVLRQLERTRQPVDDGPRETVVFDQADLSGLDLGGEWMADGIFYEANLSHARLDGAILRAAMAGGIVLRLASCCGTDFYKAGLEGADLRSVLGHGAYFSRANLLDARLDEGHFWHADFTRANCHKASFVGADLSLCTFRGASLAGADLRGVQLGWTDLSGAFLDTQTRLAGAHGVEKYVTASMIHFEGEQVEGDRAMELLVTLARQPTDAL